MNATPTANKTNGVTAAPMNNTRDILTAFKRANSLIAFRVVSSRSRDKRSASRCFSGIVFFVPQKGQATQSASAIASGALQLTH